jgi:hypothetical protein
MTDAELRPLEGWDWIQHDPDDTVPTETIAGIPGRVAQAVAQADACVSVGVAELHQYAGLSGGHKGVAMGCGGRDTILALHGRDWITRPGVQVGRLEGNPFREVVDRLGEAAGCRLALVRCGEEWIAGPPREVLKVALERLDPWISVPSPATHAWIRVPPVKAVSFYQASRAATYLALSPRPPLEDGALLVLEAACPEGLGAEQGFVAALRSHAPPWTSLLSGAHPQGPGAQRAVMLALLAQRYRLRVTGCRRAADLRAVGIDATSDPARPGSDWLEIPSPFQCLPQL